MTKLLALSALLFSVTAVFTLIGLMIAPFVLAYELWSENLIQAILSLLCGLMIQFPLLLLIRAVCKDLPHVLRPLRLRPLR